MDDIIEGDIRDEEKINNLVTKNFDIVIHLISLDHFKSEGNLKFVSSINILPVWDVLEKFTKNGLPKFIYFSTTQVYGKLKNLTINEDCNPNPLNAYGLTHLLSENICNYYNETSNTECINIRLSNSYGSPIFDDTNCWWLVINDLCKNAIENNQIKLLSDGSPLRDFIHGDDVALAVDLLIEADTKCESNIFHISSGRTLSILELAEK